MKRLIPLLLMVFVLFTVISACGKKAASSTEAATNTTAMDTNAPAADTNASSEATATN